MPTYSKEPSIDLMKLLQAVGVSQTQQQPTQQPVQQPVQQQPTQQQSPNLQGNMVDAGQAGQVAGQQLKPPPTGPLASKEVKADGTTKETYHPPQENTNQTQPARTLPNGPGGLLYPGSDTEQPGALYKVITMLAGGGAYRPSVENANLQMTALAGRYQTAKALQDKEADLQRNLIAQGGQILQANPITAWQKGIDLKGMLANTNAALTASQMRYEEANSELSSVLGSYQERLGKSMKSAKETSFKEGQTATNSKTGNKIQWRQGKWQPIKK